MSIEIGYRIAKPVSTQEQLDEYMAAAAWCNANGARILDADGYFEVVAAEAEEAAEEQDALSEPESEQEQLDEYMAAAEWCNALSELERENAELKARLAPEAAEESEQAEPDALSQLKQENAELKARLARIEEKLTLLLDGDLK